MITTIRSKMHVGDPWSRIAEIERRVATGLSQSSYFFQQQQEAIGSTTVTRIGLSGAASVTGGAGIAATTPDATGSYIQYSATTTSGSVAGWNNQALTGCLFTLPEWTFVWKTGDSSNDITSVRYWIGMGSTASPLGNNDTPAAGGECAAVRFSTVAGDTKFKLVTFDGATANVVDTGITPTVTTRYVMSIKVVSIALIELRINGMLVANSSAHLPAPATALQHRMALVTQTTGGTAKVIRNRLMRCESVF